MHMTDNKFIRGGLVMGLLLGLILMSGCTSEEPTTYTIGDRVEVGELAYTINSYEIKEDIKFYHYGLCYNTLTPEGVFVIVNLTVENLGDESRDFSSEYVQLMDSQKRSFKQNPNTRTVPGRLSTDQLQPGMPKTGVMVFDVRAGERYTIKVRYHPGPGVWLYAEITLD
jgi:hypothetical protein